jgi:hypothetical protein
VTANDILRAAGPVGGLEDGSASELVAKVVVPALTPAEIEFGSTLSRISLEDMACSAASLKSGKPEERQA